MTPGLPPVGATGQFLGFDAEGYAYVLEWSDAEEAWVGSGFDPSMRGQYRLTPLAFAAVGSRDSFIVQHQALSAEGRAA